MNKINAIVFSSDKASQLKLFLDSVNKNASEIFKLNVIINYTDNDYKKAYDIVICDSQYNHVNFIYSEDDFKGYVLDFMNYNSEYTCFFLDDDVIYKEISLEDITNPIKADDDVVCFSLRLGKNTTKCYTLGAENVMNYMIKSGDTMKWDWTLHYLDFGYPFSMNGHIFRKSDIYKLVRKSKFSNVEELEMALYEYTDVFPRNMMVSYTESRLVNIPCGRVQMSLDDEMTIALKESESRIRRKSMNNLFLNGSFINLESIDFSNIEGCHQKVDLGDFEVELESTSMDMIAIRKYGKRWNEITDKEREEINTSIDKIEDMVKKNKQND